MAPWIDFVKLRSRLKFPDVMAHYQMRIDQRTGQLVCFCPLPGHGKQGNERSFSANLDRGLFQCFGCGAKGNILDFAVLMESRDPKDGADVRRVALELQRKFCGDVQDERPAPKRRKDDPKSKTPELPLELEVAVNEPLDFALQGLAGGHPSLLERGLTKETVGYFGLGYCERGYFAGRIAIPLHDFEGKLIGYAGRVVDDEEVNGKNPQYLFPERRERAGKVLEFRRSGFLYNAHRLAKGTNDLYVVQGFPSVWWLTQHGYGHCVATLGADCSEIQAELIVNIVTPTGRVWIVPNADAEGDPLAHAVLRQVAPYRFVRWLRLDDGKQPADLSPDELKEIFAW